MQLTIEQLDNHELHLKKLLSTFRFSLKVREFKAGGKYAGYHSEGSWRGSFPTALLPNLLAKGHLEETGRETMDGDAFITYRPTLKGHNWWVRHNAAQRRQPAAPAKTRDAVATPRATTLSEAATVPPGPGGTAGGYPGGRARRTGSLPVPADCRLFRRVGWVREATGPGTGRNGDTMTEPQPTLDAVVIDADGVHAVDPASPLADALAQIMRDCPNGIPDDAGDDDAPTR